MERMYRMLYPMRVCLITSRHEGKDNVMSASWVFPLSMEPPLFGVSVSPKRFSHDLIKNGGAFAINIPHPALEAAVRLCGSESGRDCDKFGNAGLSKEEGLRVPLIRECPSSIECELVDSIQSGDHTIFVGKAVKISRRFEAKGLYQSESGFISL